MTEVEGQATRGYAAALRVHEEGGVSVKMLSLDFCHEERFEKELVAFLRSLEGQAVALFIEKDDGSGTFRDSVSFGGKGKTKIDNTPFAHFFTSDRCP